MYYSDGQDALCLPNCRGWSLVSPDARSQLFTQSTQTHTLAQPQAGQTEAVRLIPIEPLINVHHNKDEMKDTNNNFIHT